MRRVLAIIAAVVMIGGAVLIRSRIDSGKVEEQKQATQPTGTLVCATELQAVCEELQKANPTFQTRIEEAGTTYDALVKADASPAATKIDAWFVPQPWPAMVDESRQLAGRDPLFGDASAVLGRSPVVLAVWNDRRAALEQSCPNHLVDWSCIGADAGKPWTAAGGQASWGAVKPGLPPADKSATGLFDFAQGTGQFLGRTDYARQDLQDPAYQDWATNLVDNLATPAGGTPLDLMLSQGRASIDAAGSIEALAGPAVSASRDKDNITILYPSPVATADVVVVPLRGSDPGGRVKQLVESAQGAQALAQNGWRVVGQPPATGVRTDPALPDGNGLPRAGVLQAVRETWTEIQ